MAQATDQNLELNVSNLSPLLSLKNNVRNRCEFTIVDDLTLPLTLTLNAKP